MAIDMDQFRDVFFEETSEHLANVEQLLLQLDVVDPSSEDLNAIFRAVHSIKGSSGTFGFTDLTKFSHVWEAILDKIRSGTLRLEEDMVDIFLEAKDVLVHMVLDLKNNQPVDHEEAKVVVKKLEGITGKTENTAASETTEKRDEEEDKGYGFFDDDEPKPISVENPEKEDPGYGFFEDLPDLKDSKGTSHDQASPEIPGRRETDHEGDEEIPIKRGRRATDLLEDEELPQRGGRRTTDRMVTAPSEASTIRVGVEKIDQLMNQVGELVITKAMLDQTGSQLDSQIYETIHNGLAQLERNTLDLQESIMGLRMVPIRTVFNRFPRVVRELSKVFTKKVCLNMVGEETEIDRGFIEKLVDPLTHLIRNSMDHGIESAERRRALGKDESGGITLTASHQSGNVVIEVIDDGGGLHREKILEKARSKGFSVNDSMKDQEVWQLVFEAGFSTAAKVTDVSGRGVGLDVVKRNIQSMGGHVEIESKSGQGSTFRIQLPLTMAIIEGMAVGVGAETYIIPITSILESIQPKKKEMKTVMGKGQVVHVRGEYLVVLGLRELFGLTDDPEEREHSVLVLLESDGHHFAVRVDELLGKQQVVIKSMEENYKKIEGISAATILGDGKVSFILDVRGLLGLTKKERAVVGS